MIEARSLREWEPRHATSVETLEPFARRAAQLADTQIAVVTFIDDEGPRWVHATVGLAEGEAARHAAFGIWAIHNAEVCGVEDAATDARLADNPLVTEYPPIRHYAGAPIVTAAGRRLGAICVFAPAPRPVDRTLLTSLERLAQEVSATLRGED